jgi:glycosyltransferase involved in cell wall biosynthesis
MRIACITAGAGRMYCGSCLRDNTLARALMDAGHDVHLIPTYTPTRSDELNVSMHRVFLGGINVFLQQRFEALRTAPRFLSRLLDFAPLLRLAARSGMSVNPADLGELTVSMLRGTKGFLRGEILKLVQFLGEEISPEIINLPNSLLISLAPAIKAEMNVPVCCTFQGEDLFLEGLPEPHRAESIRIIREHAQYVDAFIAVSHFGARSMADYLGINLNRIHVVPLGIRLDGFDAASRNDADPFTIGYLARIAPEKGLHFLCEAYRRFRSESDNAPSRLWAAGYMGPQYRSYLHGIRTNMESLGLSDHFHYHGELDRIEKIDFLRKASAFSVPETYADPKGLFLLEAMASGTPVVQPRRGAFTEMVEATGGGILVEPDDPDALAQGLLDLWRNPDKRAEIGARGYQGVRAYYSAANMAEKALSVYRLLLK